MRPSSSLRDVLPAPPPDPERALIERVEALVGERQGEEALDRFLAGLPALLAAPVNRREKLNDILYLARRLQGATSSKHGPEKLRRKLSQLRRGFGDHRPPPGSAFLDFGCGEHDPLALAVAHWLNGFSRAIACDARGPRNPSFSARAMAEILGEIMLFPRRHFYRWTDKPLFRERIAGIDAAPFFEGDFASGAAALAGRVDYRIGDVRNLDVAEGELGLVISLAVLEHVDDAASVMDWLFRHAAPGGLQLHWIDLADHRSYRADGGYDRWSFLTEEAAPPGVNRLRLSEHVGAIEQAGFEILDLQTEEHDIPASTHERFLPRWREMAEADQRTTRMQLLIRKSAA